MSLEMRRLLNQQLVPMGYEARLVSGLQLATLDFDTLNYDPAHPIHPDVLIRRHEKTARATPDSQQSQGNPAVKEYSIPDALMLSEQEYLNALSIVRIDTPNHEIPLA